MKKYLFLTVCCITLLITIGIAQTGIVNEHLLNEGKPAKELKARNNVMADITDVLNVSGISETIFSASNVADGTDKSFHHNLRIVLNLNIDNKTEKYQLVFYSQDDKIPFAVSDEITNFSIYYPLSIYSSIKEKLDQSFAAKKKVQLKVIRKANGYREGTLIF